jgi:hypothetical protein
MSRVLPLVLLVCAVLAPAAPAAASPGLCGARAEVVDRLTAHHGETRRGRGLQPGSEGGAVVELYASERTGSWTILLTTPQGLACLLAAGRGWAPDGAATAAEGDPA